MGHLNSLSNIAGRLNSAAGATGLPPLILMTDEERLPDPVAGASRLPPGSAVLLRHYGSPEREPIGEALAGIRRSRRLDLIVAAEAGLAGDLAWRLNARGLHIPSWFAAADCGLARREVWKWRQRPGRYVTAAAHDRREMERALSLGADALIVSPVFATESHPASRPLGPHGLAELIGAAPVPVYALGGITASNVARLGPVRAAGIAGIGGILS